MIQLVNEEDEITSDFRLNKDFSILLMTDAAMNTNAVFDRCDCKRSMGLNKHLFKGYSFHPKPHPARFSL